MTEGQEFALAQLREIAQGTSGAVEIITVTPPSAERAPVRVEISIDCRGYRRAPEVLPLHQRERFIVTISPDFPLYRPEIRSTHTRFAEYPHVQWGRQLCLYQAPDTEWQPEEGVFGFMERLDAWLRAGALGQLDPIGLPLHPPVVYTKRSQLIVPRINTPIPDPPWWAGYVEITSETDVCVQLGNWVHYKDNIPNVRLAGVILLPGPMPFEYPTTIREMQRVLAFRDLPFDVLQILLELTAIRNPQDRPLYIVLGAAMRGISGATERLQHLACWHIDAERATHLRNMVVQADEDKRKLAETEFATWAEKAPVEWCSVREDRPEIIVPRDSGSPLEWWRMKRVTILGCGALGSAIGTMIVRAGAKTIKLYDSRLVAPGVLARQNFDRNQIGYTKVSATRVNLRAINPDAEITAHHGDIVEFIRTDSGAMWDADVVINTTASVGVATALEKYFINPTRHRPPILSMAIGHRAEYGLVTCAASSACGVAVDLDRRLKLALANAINGHEFLEEFWPISLDRSRLFQPEPGCSDPTFVGSAADVVGLSSALLNVSSLWMAQVDDQQARVRACVLRAPHLPQSNRQPGLLEFSWTPDRILEERRLGYQIRLSHATEQELVGWIRTSERRRGHETETGGLLFGQIDEFLKVIWINEVSGPPPDSIASSRGFVCGTAGTKALNKEKQHRTRGAVRFIGMWHTHPGGIATPSPTDLTAAGHIWEAPDRTPRKFLMLIVGGRIPSYYIEGYLFDRSERPE